MRALVLLFALLVAMPARAQPSDASAACERAIAAAEVARALPPGLLGAIARVESGRLDSNAGMARPWPWTVNADGDSLVFESKDTAVAAARALIARGARSIDVGCLQVSLAYHPFAFDSLEQAFDPAANAASAARFLRELFDQSRAWPTAASFYHSHTPELADAYRRRVLAAWGVAAGDVTGAGSGGGPPASGGWTAPPGAGPRPAAHPFAPPALADRAAATWAEPGRATATLLAAMAPCPPAATPPAWAAAGARTVCGGSPFATVSLLRRVLGR